jgi:hypothetical protein
MEAQTPSLSGRSGELVFFSLVVWKARFHSFQVIALQRFSLFDRNVEEQNDIFLVAAISLPADTTGMAHTVTRANDIDICHEADRPGKAAVIEDLSRRFRIPLLR